MPEFAKPELLAPAGNWTMLNGVIQNGADAVYFGLDEMNMRIQADNFTLDELAEIVELCHKHNVKAYLTLNTIVLDNEIKSVEAIVTEAKKSGVDAIICWDFSVIGLCRKYKIPFCVSTQASISNAIAAQQYKLLGAVRIVLARECSLKEILDIKQNTGLEIETFVHGAMCIAVSGRCFLSQEIFDRSANRGDCIQPCRREYEIYDGRKEESLLLGKDYVMSSKDLCTIEFIDELIEGGIDSFKIEGRKRSPEYAAKVTAVYRKAIDAYFEGKLNDELKAQLLAELEKVYNRGFTSGFYKHTPGAKDFAHEEGNSSGERKEYIGDVLNYFKNNSIAFVGLRTGEVQKGAKLLILGKTSGVIEIALGDFLVNDINGDSAVKGDKITFHCEQRVRPGDKVYVLRPKALGDQTFVGLANNT